MGHTCIPKPYKIVGYDPLIRGSDPQNGILDPQVEPREALHPKPRVTGFGSSATRTSDF